MRDPNPVVYLVPGVGMITFAKDKATARISAEFYVNAINVMRGASTGLDLSWACREQEAFDIEYWLLEEAKLQRMPKPKSARGPHRARHRRRRRHRPRDGAAAAARGRLRRARRHRRDGARPRPTRSSARPRQGRRARRSSRRHQRRRR